MENLIPKRFIQVSLVFFLIAAIMGLLLRVQMVSPLPGIRYKFLLHGHSHVILLGWVFNSMLGLTLFRMKQDGHSASTSFWRILFYAFQVSVLGMMIFFPLQGYAAWSIVFSTLHILLSLVLFVYWIHKKILFSKGYSLFSWAWIFFILSTMGPLALGVIISKGLAGSTTYYLAIYFYLHFLYNGYFMCMLFWFWENRLSSSGLSLRFWKWIKILLVVSVLTGFALSTLWTFPPQWVYVLGWITGVLQLFILGLLAIQWKTLHSWFKITDTTGKWIMTVFSIALVLKFVLQLVSASKVVAYVAYRTPYYIIAYIHLVFIGLVSFALLFLIYDSGKIIRSKWLNWGLGLISVGFIGSELLLIAQPIGITNYYEWLLSASILLPVGLLLMVPQLLKIDLTKSSL